MKTLFRTTTVGLASLAATSIALAQATDSSQTAQRAALQEVVVSARRVSESLQDTPVSVVSVSGDDLQDMGIDNIETLDAFIPNVTTGTGMGNSGWASFNIRGIGGGQGWVYQENGVGVYIDDVYYPRANGALLDVVDVEQIEVLRGPQGTLFGRNTSGGAIRYVTTKPQPEFSGRVSGSLGNYDRQDVTGIINIPLTDTLSSRFTVASKSRDGFIDRLNDDIKMGNSEVTAARAQLRWQPDHWDINLSTDAIETENDGVARSIVRRDPTHLFPSFLPAGSYTTDVPGDNFEVEGGTLPERNSVESYGVTLTAEYFLNDNITLKSLTGYRDNESNGRNDWDLSDADLFQTETRIDFSNWSQEFQLNGTFLDGRLSFVSGLYYMEEEAFMNNDRTGVPPITALEIIDLETTSTAIYTQGSYDLTDALSFTLGLRWSEDEKDFYSAYRGVDASNSDSWSSVTPRIGFEYRAAPDVMLYVSAAKGFKSGGFNNRPNPALPNDGILPYDPENLWTYEAGVRSEFADNRIRLNVTYFHTSYEDIQTSSPVLVDGRPVQVTENAAEATSQRIEFELMALVTDNLSVNAAGGWIDAEYDSLGNASSLTMDTPFARTPEYSLTLGAEYVHSMESGATVIAKADYGWKDKQFNHDSSIAGFYLPSYGLLNGRISYEPPAGQWKVALFGTNLLDDEYKVSGFGGNPIETFFGFEHADWGRPREYGVELTVNF